MFKGKTSTVAEISGTFGFRAPESKPTWILVANRNGAKLLETRRGATRFDSPKKFSFSHAKLRGSDSYRAHAGRAFNSSSQSHGGHGTATPRHALGSETDHHEIAARKFATTPREGEECSHLFEAHPSSRTSFPRAS